MKTTFLALLCWATLSKATCYFPDGTTATSMEPCPITKSCCGKDEACLSNGLCFGANLGVIYRGSCSDSSWPIADCPRACYTDTEIPSSYANLFQCPDNGEWKNMTCSSRGDAETACGIDAVGSWTYVSGGNVTTARNGESTSTTNVTDSSSTQTINATCTKAATGSSGHSTLALGVGLGAGLGVPLLISTALLIYCANSRRLPDSRQKTNMEGIATCTQSTYPMELNGAGRAPELEGKLRSELQG
ncbi:hypothetical protein N7490_009311 [Penicillium lividum]|nr:hypothetical protein N7490_009311 [Penicillium lividum]